MNNKREHDRFEMAEDVMFANTLMHPFCYYGGSIINCSKSGVCLSSRYEVACGDQLCLRMIGKQLQSCTSIDDLTCVAEVKWCQPVNLTREPKYRIGLHYSGHVPVRFKP